MTGLSRAGAYIHATSTALSRGVILLIQLYRHMVSPLRPATCRFVPTCSRYAVDALGEYGLGRGSWLAALRLAKCGPWHAGGWDPIPEHRGCQPNSEDVSDTRDSRATGESEARV